MIAIKPVSNWASLAAQAKANGCRSAGEFLLALALSNIAPDVKGVREIMRVFTEATKQ